MQEYHLHQLAVTLTISISLNAYVLCIFVFNDTKKLLLLVKDEALAWADDGVWKYFTNIPFGLTTFDFAGNTTIQYSPNLPSSPSPPHSPTTASDTSLNVSMVTGNAGIPGQDTVGGVQVLVDSTGSSAGVLAQGGSRGRGRGGRGGRGRGGGRGRRSTSGPPPEIDHSIEVITFTLGIQCLYPQAKLLHLGRYLSLVFMFFFTSWIVQSLK